jgi:hypothetical protein
MGAECDQFRETGQNGEIPQKLTSHLQPISPLKAWAGCCPGSHDGSATIPQQAS